MREATKEEINRFISRIDKYKDREELPPEKRIRRRNKEEWLEFGVEQFDESAETFHLCEPNDNPIINKPIPFKIYRDSNGRQCIKRDIKSTEVK